MIVPEGAASVVRTSTLALWMTAVCLSVVRAETWSGRVLEDHTGRPVFLAGVRVLRPGGDAASKIPLMTGADGRFQTPNLPPGEYHLEIFARDYLETRVRIVAPASPLTIRLARLGAISGRVTDLDGKPNRGARVTVLVKPAQGLRLQPFGVSYPVDRNGRYRASGLPPGEYAVAVANAVLDAAGARPYYYPRNARPQFFTITSGEEFRDINFALPAVPLYRVTGRITGQPEGERAVVSLYVADQPVLPLATAWSSRNGVFALDEVPPGDYHLLATRPTYGYGVQGGMLTPEDVLGESVMTVSGDVDDVMLAPAKRGDVSLILPGATPPEGCPESFSVTLTQILAPGAGQRRTVTAAFGRKSVLEALPAGRYRIAASLPEACSLLSPPVATFAQDGTQTAYLLEPASSAALQGQVPVSPSRPQGFAVVLLPAAAGGQPVKAWVVFPAQDGRFLISHLPPGRYRIAARPLDAAPATRWIPQPAEMTEIELLPGQTEKLPLLAPPLSYK